MFGAMTWMAGGLPAGQQAEGFRFAEAAALRSCFDNDARGDAEFEKTLKAASKELPGDYSSFAPMLKRSNAVVAAAADADVVEKKPENEDGATAEAAEAVTKKVEAEPEPEPEPEAAAAAAVVDDEDFVGFPDIDKVEGWKKSAKKEVKAAAEDAAASGTAEAKAGAEAAAEMYEKAKKEVAAARETISKAFPGHDDVEKAMKADLKEIREADPQRTPPPSPATNAADKLRKWQSLKRTHKTSAHLEVSRAWSAYTRAAQAERLARDEAGRKRRASADEDSPAEEKKARSE